MFTTPADPRNELDLSTYNQSLLGDSLYPLGMQTKGLPPFSSQDPEEDLGYSQSEQNSS